MKNSIKESAYKLDDLTYQIKLACNYLDSIQYSYIKEDTDEKGFVLTYQLLSQKGLSIMIRLLENLDEEISNVSNDLSDLCFDEETDREE